MKAYVGTFRIRTGLGTQTITGIVDRDGLPFVPEHIVLVNGSSVVNTLHSVPPGSEVTAASVNTNVYRVADAAAGYQAIANFNYTFPNLLVTSGGNGAGVDAACDSLLATPLAGGRVYRTAAISNVILGGCDLTVTREDAPDDTDVMLLVLGSTSGDLHLEQLANSAGTVIPTTFPAAGLLNPKVQPLQPTGVVAAVAGGPGGWGWGWDSPQGGVASLHVALGHSSGPPNYTYQSHQSFDSTINVIAGTAVDPTVVVAWHAASLTVSAPVVNSDAHVVGGPTIVTASGTCLQPTGTGRQAIPLGIDARVVFLASTGRPPSATLQSPTLEGVVGWTDGVRRVSTWVGETALTPPPMGAVYLSNTSLLRFAQAGAQGPSTVFTAVADFVSLTAQGVLTIDWTETDGVGRELLWFAIGHPLPPPIPPPPPGTIEPIRRLRQAPHLWDGTSGHRLKYPGFQLLVEAGAPRDTDGPMSWVLQWSDDGGHSWSHEHRIEGSRLGDHTFRFWWRRLGQSRDRVFRVVNSDDAKIVVIDALLVPDPVEGSS